MKITTKANIEDTLFFLIEKNGYFKLLIDEVFRIKIDIEDKVYEIYIPKTQRYNEFYLNGGEYSKVFLKKEDAEKEIKKLNEVIKKEKEESDKRSKEYKKQKALEEITKIAKKNKIKIEIN